MHPKTNFATCAATWRIWYKIWTRQLCAVPDVIVSRAMSPFAKLLWSSLFSATTDTLWHVRRPMDDDFTVALVHAFVSSRVDYCCISCWPVPRRQSLIAFSRSLMQQPMPLLGNMTKGTQSTANHWSSAKYLGLTRHQIKLQWTCQLHLQKG